MLVLAPGASLAEEAGRNAVAAAKADCIVSANFCPEFCQPDYAFFTNSKRFEKLDLAALPCPVVLTSNLRPLPQGALAVNYDRLAAPDVQNASLGSNSVLMLLRLLRLCGAKAVYVSGAGSTVMAVGEKATAEKFYSKLEKGLELLEGLDGCEAFTLLRLDADNTGATVE